jgi:hypothetical protein
MDILEQLKDISEIQIDSNGEREDSYRPYSCSAAANIQSQLLTVFPNALSSAIDPELISLHQSDGVNYFDKTVSVIYKGGPSKQEQSLYATPIDKFSDCYGYKFLLNEKRYIMKAYDANMWKHPLPALPAGTQIAEQFGIGMHFGATEMVHFRDVYFFHENRDKVMDFFNKDIYTALTESQRGLFGLVFDAITLEVYKLKQYIYPNDLNLNNPQRV